ncbi:allophanate hydrolase [Streptomyces scabiei]|uniref:allophanate hydrolase n=2 Tax=Streptomyces scabiei TaxID=1930 RepID=UPI001B317351|nr:MULTISPECIES: allophanate hydrolase [Streptomyces]MBP5874592.1 allophanate hydrolase [Streptomyces sp. LBUM 1477]MBP5882342.1 allophanate hydrolase [Streptomyces sp. LBUM 1487]MDX3167905.1 allophanate hydrolase [Streptomyces scabiei]QTU44848.1 allophanate hydrolase [Streptomyces sp. LBUM 1482]QTU60980.1 allophanate hydrolase [Streptomyces sp. LBUM 1475]
MPSPTLTRVRTAYARIEAVDRPEIWIGLRPRADAEAEAEAIDARLAAGAHLPLAGRLLAVKGNIDVHGLPTTAGCPAYAYAPDADAPVVARLRAAGALVLGTTNLDQFATGLVGTRSPYGAVRGAHDPSRISGGSSSGSAVAVALGIVDLALGTDTAGSGRVPAAFNGIVGLKPTRGLVPTAGVVPACASIDCVTVFARTLPEAEQALAHMSSPPGRPLPPLAARPPGPWRVAVPPREQLGELDEGWAEAYESAVSLLRAAGADVRPLDLTPFTEAAAMLYQGAFVAERYTAVGAFVDKALADGVDSLDPTVAGIITRARDVPAHGLFADQDRLAVLRARALAELGDADALLLPTAPGHPTLAEVAADPLGANARLGRFTNSTNLFDLAAVAVPAGEVNGLPFGVMLIGPAFTDDRLARVAALLRPEARLAVVGAHLSGQPLNPQLLSLGARLERTTTTAPVYRLHALRTTPPKPGLVHVGEGGAAVEAEIWRLPAEGLGRLLAALPRPMALGTVELSDGTRVPGFLCEPAALRDAEDITAYGGWRGYLSR